MMDAEELYHALTGTIEGLVGGGTLTENQDSALAQFCEALAPVKWTVEVYSTGWATIADNFESKEAAESFLAQIAAKRTDGTTGLQVRQMSVMS